MSEGGYSRIERDFLGIDRVVYYDEAGNIVGTDLVLKEDVPMPTAAVAIDELSGEDDSISIEEPKQKISWTRVFVYSFVMAGLLSAIMVGIFNWLPDYEPKPPTLTIAHTETFRRPEPQVAKQKADETKASVAEKQAPAIGKSVSASIESGAATAKGTEATMPKVSSE